MAEHLPNIRYDCILSNSADAGQFEDPFFSIPWWCFVGEEKLQTGRADFRAPLAWVDILLAVYHVIMSDILLEYCINYPEKIAKFFVFLYG